VQDYRPKVEEPMTADRGEPPHTPVTLDAAPGPDGRWSAQPRPAPGWLIRVAQFAVFLLAAGAVVLVWITALALLVVLAPIALLAGAWLWHKASRQADARRAP
jgi:hypothetical protein